VRPPARSRGYAKIERRPGKPGAPSGARARRPGRPWASFAGDPQTRPAHQRPRYGLNFGRNLRNGTIGGVARAATHSRCNLPSPRSSLRPTNLLAAVGRRRFARPWVFEARAPSRRLSWRRAEAAPRSGSARLAPETTLMTPNRPSSVGSYLGPSLASCFLISGLSYKTTFNSELRISSFPLYSI
jgi:hypothetical protein